MEVVVLSITQKAEDGNGVNEGCERLFSASFLTYVSFGIRLRSAEGLAPMYLAWYRWKSPFG